MYHTAVLLDESIKGLSIHPDGIYVDATFGSGGHSMAILKQLKKGRLLAFDQDEDAKQNLFKDEKFIFIQNNFNTLQNFLQYYKTQEIDGLLADLGVSSHQINEPERGFSYRFDAPLDFRMNITQELNGFHVINHYDVKRLQTMFSSYGDIQNAKTLAEQIVNSRKEKMIQSTFELIHSIESCILRKERNQYLAKVFQSIRIEVNNEMKVLEELLEQAYRCLKAGGRLVVISYHSVEDRMVKNFIKSGNIQGVQEKDFFGQTAVKFKMINRKPIVPTEQEVQENPRARSAKLRVAEKI